MFDFNPFDDVIDAVQYFFSEEFWARLFRIAMGSVLILLALATTIRSPVLWRR
jgi:hypothetical protein